MGSWRLAVGCPLVESPELKEDGLTYFRFQEHKTYYRNFGKRFGFPVGIEPPISKAQASRLPVSFLLVHKEFMLEGWRLRPSPHFDNPSRGARLSTSASGGTRLEPILTQFMLKHHEPRASYGTGNSESLTGSGAERFLSADGEELRAKARKRSRGGCLTTTPNGDNLSAKWQWDQNRSRSTAAKADLLFTRKAVAAALWSGTVIRAFAIQRKLFCRSNPGFQ